MASYRMSALAQRTIPLFSKEAYELLNRVQIEAHSYPWMSEETLQASTGGGGGGGREGVKGEGPYGQGEPTCLSCLVSFGSREEQVEHYKLDWHRYNVKRRLRGLECVPQGDFEKLEGEMEGYNG